MSGRAIYLGSFTSHTGGKGPGISLTHQDPDTGELSMVGLVAEGASPAFLAWHPDGRHLYAVNEDTAAGVTAYEVAADGTLRELGKQLTGGKGACHLTVHPTGTHVIAANYGSGSVSVLPLDADGNVGERTDLVQHEGRGPNPDRQNEPHAHQARVDPSGQWVLVNDLGTDAVCVYTLDRGTGRLRPAPVPFGRATPGSGPRHLVFGDGYVYVAGELDSTVQIFSWDANLGALDLVGTSPSIVADPGEGNYPSEIARSEDGRFCYVANRGRDQITTLSVDGAHVRPVADVPTGGAWPRHMAVVGEYLYVANERSHQVTHFKLDPNTGVPEQVSELGTNSPACIMAAPAR